MEQHSASKIPAEEIEYSHDERYPDKENFTEYNAYIAVMGGTGTGKTTFINLASGSDLRVGTGLRSETSEIQISVPFELENGQSVILIDTPGFDDTTRSEMDILTTNSAFLTTMYDNSVRLSGVIYTHRISDSRMTGSSLRNFKMITKLCGADSLQNFAIVTNMWGSVSQEMGERREQELRDDEMFFKPIIEGGAQIYRHQNTKESAHSIISSLVEKPTTVLQIQKELVDMKLRIEDTGAGQELCRKLEEQKKKDDEELKQLQKDLDEAADQKDWETRKELEEEMSKLRSRIESEERRRIPANPSLSSASGNPRGNYSMSERYETERNRLTTEVYRSIKESRRLAKEAEDKNNREIAKLEKKIEACERSSEAERRALEREIASLNRLKRRRKRRPEGGFGNYLGWLFGLPLVDR